MGRAWKVLCVLVIAGCGGGGGDDKPSPKPQTCREGNEPDGPRLVFTAEALAGDAGVADAEMNLVRSVLYLRLASAGVSGNVAREGADQVIVTLPSGTDATAQAERLIQRGHLELIDWEANRVDPADCKTHPDEVGSGLDGTSRLAAEQALEECPQTDVRLVEAEATETVAHPNRWFLLRERPALTGDDILNPDVFADPQTNEPGIVMDLTPEGQEKFAAVTRTIAHRGQDNAPVSQDPIDSSQHFGIVLDDQLLTLPYINWTENPDGISGDTGLQISGGYTQESAEALVDLLRSGELPVRLMLSP